MNKFGNFAAAALLALSGLSLALPAEAVPSIRITQGTNVLVVEDETLQEYATPGSDEIIEVDAEDLLIVDDEEESGAESAGADGADSGDAVENDLRDFLQGLD